MKYARKALCAIFISAVAGCGRGTPTFVTKYGTEVFDSYGWLVAEDFDAAEDWIREVFVKRGMSPESIDECFAETEVEVFEELDCKSGHTCYGYQNDETIAILKEGRWQMSSMVFLHEVVHRLFDCDSADPDGDHSDPIWTGHDAEKAMLTFLVYLGHRYNL
jgi:hypothetical protein